MRAKNKKCKMMMKWKMKATTNVKVFINRKSNLNYNSNHK